MWIYAHIHQNVYRSKQIYKKKMRKPNSEQIKFVVPSKSSENLSHNVVPLQLFFHRTKYAKSRWCHNTKIKKNAKHC